MYNDCSYAQIERHSGIPLVIYNRLRRVLLECGPFASDGALRAIFVDARINPWRNELPQANSPAERVDAVIDLLFNQYRVAMGNALVLLLRVLIDRTDPDNVCHRDLATLADELDATTTGVAVPESWEFKLAAIRQAIVEVLSAGQPGQIDFYLKHVSQVIKYLTHFVQLLQSENRLNERETFLLMAAAHLYGIGKYFPHPEDTLTLKNYSKEIDKLSPDLILKLITDHYAEVSHEWIKHSVIGDALYPSLGLESTDPVPEIALICLGCQDSNLGGEQYNTLGTGKQRVRLALLTALLSVANMLASVLLKPKASDLQDSDKPLEVQLSAWLHYYLDRIAIQSGHIRFCYQLPTEEYHLAVRVLLSGAMQLRLRELRDVLTANGLVIVIDSSVSCGQVYEMPRAVLAFAQGLAYQRLTSVVAALGVQPDRRKFHYHLTGLRGSPALEWERILHAERYEFKLFDTQENLLYQCETTTTKILIPEDKVNSDVKYLWIVQGYRGRQRLKDWEGGIFWLINEQTAAWIGRQIAWYQTLEPYERNMMEGRILANYGVYEEARHIYQTMLDQGPHTARLQARQELIRLYEDISQQLNRLGHSVSADHYLDAGLALAKELQREIAQERLEMKRPPQPSLPVNL